MILVWETNKKIDSTGEECSQAFNTKATMDIFSG